MTREVEPQFARMKESPHDLTTDSLVAPTITPEDRRKAARRTLSASMDAADAQYLLDMLGLEADEARVEIEG